MKKFVSDRVWISIILIFLAAEVVWLLADFQIINNSFFTKKKISSDAVEAGYVIKITDELKRRNSNSLIWDLTKENDVLYYNDSILTLSQGSAKLYLKDKTELQLSENTLITLEEPEAGTNSEIRLRFSKGDLKARNPFSKTKVIGDDWIVNLEKGSEVSLRKEKDSYEFEVITGKAVIETDKGEKQDLDDSTILKLSVGQQIEKIEKNQNLKWSDQKPIRVYVYEETAKISLGWQGEAKNLMISKPGDEDKRLDILQEKKNADLDLALGSYKVRLADETGLSAAREIEVLKAPKVYLKKPLPRDRLKVGENYEFVWATEDGLKEYRLKVGSQILSTKENFKNISIESEEDITWSVEALDEEGYVIPPFYESKIYFRDDPLPAPKLKNPTIRTYEKQKGSSIKFEWLKIFVNRAQAATSKEEAVFEWEAVVGADQYIIEISSDPDFRKPEVIETLKSTEFVWKKYDSNKKYFWRVAAGTKKGRMGVFSEPIEFKPVLVEVASKKEEVIKIEEPALQKPKPEIVVLETEIPPPIKIAEPKIEIKPVMSWSIALAPGFKVVSLKGEQSTNVQLQGPVLFGLYADYKNEDYTGQFYLSSETWKPKSTTELPFQENLKIPELWAFINFKKYGMSLHQSFIPIRNGDELINYQSVSVLGFRYLLKGIGISLGTSGKVHELNFDYTYKKYIFNQNNQMKYFMGTSMNALYQSQKNGGGYQSNIQLLFGIDGL